jgi:hypothetical protein
MVTPQENPLEPMGRDGRYILAVRIPELISAVLD